MLNSKLSKDDIKFMNLAINLSKKNIGITGSNPTVGCVLVKNGEIIATGITEVGGRPHAEDIAIKKAGDNSIGSTLYVSLEPCSHFGKTAPCADLIINSKIKRVVIAAIDPDKRVNGSGLEKLKQAGIEVVYGVLEEEAKAVNAGFFFCKKNLRPLVTLKLATSWNGKIADKNYHSKWISNEKSREYAHLLRAKNDAILIGANTLKQDDPMLNCRIIGLENYSPKRIIVSDSLDIDVNSKIVKTASKIPTYIATSSHRFKKYINLGLHIIECKKDQRGGLEIADLLAKLVDLEINNLLVEGGSKIAGRFLQDNLVDKLIWIRSNKIIGEDGIPAIADFDIVDIDKKNDFRKTDILEFGDDVITTYVSDNLVI